MCGFNFSCSFHDFLTPDPEIVKLVSSRGPDDFRIVQRSVCLSREGWHQRFASGDFHFTIVASVLSLRGNLVVSQPLIDESTGSFLLWNGEAWRSGNQVISGSDTIFVFKSLLNLRSEDSECSKSSQSGLENADTRIHKIRDILQGIDGPYSFIYYDGLTNLIFYGRDALGRRSLLALDSPNGDFIMSSVSAGNESGAWREIETGGIFIMKPRQCTGGKSHESGKPGVVWSLEQDFIPWSTEWRKIPPLNRDLTFTEHRTRLPSLSTVTKLEQMLQGAVQTRLTAEPPFVEYNKGTTQYAVLFSGGVDCTLLALLADKILPQSDTIDLLNVAFENPRTIAAATSRMLDQPSPTSLPNFGYEICPDRITGLSSFHQLVQLRPNRRWRFVSINISYAEVEAQKELVSRLMYPHNTEMDLSIALALFFVARGSGQIFEGGQEQKYTTTARVLLSGFGADELFGGYTRHAKAYNRDKYAGLLEELNLDFERIANRNLGRDDRVISHWAREVRYPYLDEAFVRWVLELPIWEKCGFGVDTDIWPYGVVTSESGKLSLRLLTAKLGLQKTACEKKRAIQFGARTARMSRSRKRGDEAI